jgi:2-oxo-4-hydroxy-4-carboxy-5-ureidoimidazoline decarboxylase
MEPWRRIDASRVAEARALLMACCGSSRWVDRMLARRPFGSRVGLLTAAREEWDALQPGDWREAFAHHPRIGDREALRARFPATHHLSETEQAGVAGASDAVRNALADANRAYEEQFGFIFIVCASGKTAEEMLATLHRRMTSHPADELRTAAAEQAKITALRLDALRE